MQLSAHELAEHAEFNDDSSFKLKSCPFPAAPGEIPLGFYELPRRSGEAHRYRLNHPLAEAILAQAQTRKLPWQEVRFDGANHDGIISVLEPVVGQSGWLTPTRFSVESLDQSEDHLIFSAVTDAGESLDETAAVRRFTLPGEVAGAWPDIVPDMLATGTEPCQALIQHNIAERNAVLFESEAGKLDGWADDLKMGLERTIKAMDRQIKEARRAAATALTSEEKLAAQRPQKEDGSADAGLAPTYQKVGGSRAIGPHLNPTANRSQSFGVFVAGIRKLTSLGTPSLTQT